MTSKCFGDKTRADISSERYYREDLLAKVQLPIITCFILPDSGLLKEWQIQSCYRGGSPDHRCFLHMKCFMLLPIKKLSL